MVNAPSAAYSSPYDTSRKLPSMSQIPTPAYFSTLPASTRSSYYQSSPSPQASPSSGDTSTELLYHHEKSAMASYAPSSQSVASYSLRHDTHRKSLAASETDKNISRLSDELAYPASAVSREPEKRMLSTSSPRRSARYSYQDVERNPFYGVPEESEEPLDLQTKAFSILLYLALFNPLVSMGVLGWTLAALFISVFLLPLKLLSKSGSPCFTSLIMPPLRQQLRLIYSQHTSPNLQGRTGVVLTIHLVSPILALGFAVSSWVVALFWFFSAVLGDPAGKDGHNDGKAAVLWLRGKWESWLQKGLIR